MDEKAKRFWSHGISMRKALVTVPPKDRVREYQSHQQQTATPVYLTAITKGIESGHSLSESVLDANKIVENYESSRKLLEQFVLKYIKNGQLSATGFSLPRRASDMPEFVPADIWSSDWCGGINWDRGTIKANGLNMVEVRLTHASWLNRSLHRKEIESSPGRPTRVDHIKLAFKELLESNKIDIHAPFNSHSELIRAYVLLHYPNENNDAAGLGEQRITRTVTPLIKAERANV